MMNLTSKNRFCRTIAALLYAASVIVFAQSSEAASEVDITAAQQLDAVFTARTGSPRQTLLSWLNLVREAENIYELYLQERTHVNVYQFVVNADDLLFLLDLSQTPAARRHEIGYRASYAIADILVRMELPPVESVPDWDPFDKSAPSVWRIPGTPITIARIDEGARAGEFLFSARTVANAPKFFERIRHLPLNRPSPVESWMDQTPQMTGPVFPAALVVSLPDSLKKTIMDTPIWKIFVSVVSLSLAAALMVLIHRWIAQRPRSSRFATLIRKALPPLAALALARVWYIFIQAEVNVTGDFARLTDSTLLIVQSAAFAWLFWAAVLAVFEWMVRSPRIGEESLNANVMRLCAKVIGSLGILLIMALGAQDLGIPVLGVAAGLGFGGLALALAIRPSLENLMGGVILFVDKPVRVGDFCSFGSHMGTVENIGIRSTKVRALDRTLISIPNATFVDMELVNWAECDQMLILTVIGLRYETTPDQLRYVLATVREMLYAHPKIDRSTVRVRYVGYGPSSRDVEIRVYALTQEWNEFYAIREDVFLRVDQIVAESGTSFAFPSQTLYFGRDEGLDQERSESAEKVVGDWRRTGALPFPDSSSGRVDNLAGTLDYPPRGSVEEHRPDAGEASESEQLSAPPSPAKSEDKNTTDKR